MNHVHQLRIEALEERIAPLVVGMVPPGADHAADAANVPDIVYPHRADCHPVGPDLIVCTLA